MTPLPRLRLTWLGLSLKKPTSLILFRSCHYKWKIMDAVRQSRKKICENVIKMSEENFRFLASERSTETTLMFVIAAAKKNII
jgi:hypothetical protein